MDINQLRAFVAVAKHGSFTRAAEELHLSQPTVSGQIKALEADLGVLLFERNASGVSTTSAGSQLLPRADRILMESRALIAHGTALGGRVSGKMKLGAVIDAKLLRLGALLSEMRLTYPDIEVETHHGLAGWVMAGVRRKDLDYGFFVGPVAHTDVSALFLTKLTYRIVAPATWSDKVKAAGWREIAAMPWIWTPEQSAYPQIAAEMFSEHGVQPNIVTVADRESTVVNLVTSGVGLGLLRESLALTVVSTKELVLWEDGATQADLSFINLIDRQEEPAIFATRNTVAKIWA